MTIRGVNWATTRPTDPDLEKARSTLLRVQKDVKNVIAILTAEQALRAEKVVREAGRRGH